MKKYGQHRAGAIRPSVASTALLMLLWGLGIASVAWPAAGQQAQNIERRLPNETRPPPGVPPEEAILTGEDDIVLLRRRKFFSLDVGADARYTTNAFLSDDLKDDDFVVTGHSRFRAETRIAGRYTVYLEAGIFASRYEDNAELDYDGVFTGLGASFPVRSWTLGASYRASNVQERGFGAHIITQHELTASVAYGLPLDQNSLLFPYLIASRLFASPSEFERTAVRPGMSFVRQVGPDLALVADARLLAVSYDDYFERAFGRARRDYGATGGITLRWTPSAAVTASGSIGGAYVNSTDNQLDYSELSVAPSLNLKIRF